MNGKLNKYWRSDQLVFTFINSEECTSFQSLVKFLIRNRYPLLERWAFYCLGKFKEVDSKAIQSISNDRETDYGGLIKGELYYWKEYLNFDSEELNEEFERFSQRYNTSDYEPKINMDALPEEHIMLGWYYVYKAIDHDIEAQRKEDRAMMGIDEEVEGFSWYDPFEGHGNWGQGDGY